MGRGGLATIERQQELVTIEVYRIASLNAHYVRHKNRHIKTWVGFGRFKSLRFSWFESFECTRDQNKLYMTTVEVET